MVATNIHIEVGNDTTNQNEDMEKWHMTHQENSHQEKRFLTQEGGCVVL